MQNQKLLKLFHFLKNKYTLSILFLLVWLIFIDRYDFVTQYRSVAELKRLEKEKAYYELEISRNDKNLKQLQNDPVYLERFAREKYLMKGPNEDVFIIIDKSKVNGKEISTKE